MNPISAPVGNSMCCLNINLQVLYENALEQTMLYISITHHVCVVFDLNCSALYYLHCNLHKSIYLK